MKRTVLSMVALLAGGGVFVSGCGSPGSPPPAGPLGTVDSSGLMPVMPAVSINAVMVDLIDHAAHHVWDIEQEGRAPKTDAEWETVIEHAVQIAAAAPAITVGGTGPSDAVWVKSPAWHTYAQRMSDAGVAAMKAATRKDLPALVTANGQLVQSCETCHQEFKPSVPTEGIVHKHGH